MAFIAFKSGAGIKCAMTNLFSGWRRKYIYRIFAPPFGITFETKIYVRYYRSVSQKTLRHQV